MKDEWATPKRNRYTLDTLEQADAFATQMRNAGFKDVEVKPMYQPKNDPNAKIVGMSVYWTEENTD